MMIERKLIETLPFSIDARVAIQLGRESISSSLIAISELVKNAYDADAEEVRIKFLNLDTADATMVIEDDGSGMDSTELKNNWLRIGTDFKIKSEKSRHKKRVLTGSKGLGRLGIDRLCRKLILQTKAETSKNGIELEVNWGDYENRTETNLEEITHNIYEISGNIHDIYGDFPFRKGYKGTRLILSGLKDDWTEKYISELKKELSLLVSPFKNVKDFKIHLKSGYTKIDGLLESRQYLQAAEWKLHAAIDENNMVLLEVSSSRFNEHFKDGPTAWKDWIKDRKDIPRCGPLRLEMYFIPERPDQVLRSINFEKKTVMEFLRNNQGIRIYRDQFRVKPYGEPSGDGDWLNLSLRRATSPGGVAQGGWKVAYHQVVGAVFITREHNRGLIDQTNREGLVEEPPFFDLRAFAIKAVGYFELKLHQYAKRQKDQTEIEKARAVADESATKSKNNLRDLKEEVKKLNQKVGPRMDLEAKAQVAEIVVKIENVEDTVNQAIESSRSLEAILETTARALQVEKDTLANLASLGILTVSFGHETKGAANVASINSKLLRKSFDEGKFMLPLDVENKFIGYIDRVQSGTEYVSNFANFALENVKWDKRKRRLIHLNDVWVHVESNLKPSLIRKNINIDSSSVSSDIQSIRGFVIDWESIFVNLITNAIWALEDTPSSERIISISINSQDNFIIVNFADSGKGIEKGTEEMIFMPTFSTKRNRKGEQIGTGMGLSIVKTFIEDHADGSIDVKSPGRLGGAEFIIRVPTYIERKRK